MIAIKNGQELACMRKACKITAAARALAGEMVRPGVRTKDIERPSTILSWHRAQNRRSWAMAASPEVLAFPSTTQ